MAFAPKKAAPRRPKMPLAPPPMAPVVKAPPIGRPSSKPRKQGVTPVATDRGVFGIKG